MKTRVANGYLIIRLPGISDLNKKRGFVPNLDSHKKKIDPDPEPIFGFSKKLGPVRIYTCSDSGTQNQTCFNLNLCCSIRIEIWKKGIFIKSKERVSISPMLVQSRVLETVSFSPFHAQGYSAHIFGAFLSSRNL